MATYLDFEENIKKIEDEIIVAKTRADEYAATILQKIIPPTVFLNIKEDDGLKCLLISLN